MDGVSIGYVYMKRNTQKKCQKCGTKTYCYDSRPREAFTIRRYECVAGHRYTTLEFVVDPADGRKMVSHSVLQEYEKKYWEQVKGVETLEKIKALLRD